MSKILSGEISLMNYPYFISVCVLMMLFAAGVLVCPRTQRVPMVLSALISTPSSLASFFFDPEYWHPVRIIDYWVGIEDLMFSFATGGLVWLFALWPLNRKIRFNLKADIIFKRNAVLVIFGFLIFTILRHSGFGVMAAVLISSGLLTLILLYLRHDIFPVWLIGFSSFTLFYLLLLKAFLLFFPNFIYQWNAHALWGYYPWGIPLEELAWAAVFGGVWPMMMLYIFDAMPHTRKRNLSGIEAV